jgi:8-oxo-dGTP pyrophosphatase MutT (NUDIX family)
MDNLETERKLPTIEAISGIFVNKNGKILLVRRNLKRTYNPGTCDLIGGDVPPGETPIQTLARDAEEKLGIKLSEETVETKGVKNIEAPNTIIRRHIFVCQISNKISIKIDPKKYDQYGWYDASQVEQLDLTPGVKEILISVGLLKE